MTLNLPSVEDEHEERDPDASKDWVESSDVVGLPLEYKDYSREESAYQHHHHAQKFFNKFFLYKFLK